MEGHWKSIDGLYHVWIASNHVQLFKNRKLEFNEPLKFEYLEQDNVCAISESIILWMISPQDGNVFLSFNDTKIEFTRR